MDTKRGPGKPFQNGNRHGRGRPAGSRNKGTIALQELLEGEGEAIIRKVIKLEKAGNESAIRLCMDRLIAPRRERPVQLTLPSDIGTAEGISGALAAILDAITQGGITVGEAVQLASVLEVRRKAIETREYELRLSEVEAGMK